jgi:hypothetical protein
MNYLLLKWILDATLSHFICRNCSGKADEKMVEISWIHDSVLHIEVRCPHCWLVSSIKAEVNMVGSNNPFSNLPDQTKKGSGSIFDSSHQIVQNKKTSLNQYDLISDDDILQLRNNLWGIASVTDMFGSNDN